VRGELVLLHMTEPRDFRLNRKLFLDGHSLTCHFVHTGVPHAVVEVSDLVNAPVHSLGSIIRHHPDFAPAGANANFITVTGPDALRIRTYERGVEAETQACGTGIVAAALIAGRLGRVTAPVTVTPSSGDELRVNFTLNRDQARDVTLLGPAVFVCEGRLEYNR
jgi:diaminopimelate epimerase